jgi:hypothetical protein
MAVQALAEQQEEAETVESTLAEAEEGPSTDQMLPEAMVALEL